jgi:hypothetical protein
MSDLMFDVRCQMSDVRPYHAGPVFLAQGAGGWGLEEGTQWPMEQQQQANYNHKELN